MNGGGLAGLDERQKAQEKLIAFIEGGKPLLPMAGDVPAMLDLGTSRGKYSGKASELMAKRLRAAMVRDIRYASSGYVWQMSYALASAPVEVFHGSKFIVDSQTKEAKSA